MVVVRETGSFGATADSWTIARARRGGDPEQLLLSYGNRRERKFRAERLDADEARVIGTVIATSPDVGA